MEFYILPADATSVLADDRCSGVQTLFLLHVFLLKGLEPKPSVPLFEELPKKKYDYECQTYNLVRKTSIPQIPK